MKVRVRLFAVYREILDADWVDLELPEGASVAGAFDQLFPEGSDGSQYRGVTAYAVNRSYADPDSRLQEGDEVAFIPPVAGG
jgi:molybdopterin converting factor subunit 1